MERSSLSLEEYIRSEADNALKLNNDIDWNQIPLLNYVPLHTVADNTLVRFRGMVQDMLDPEIYLEKYVVNWDDNGTQSRLQNGKYRDTLVCKANEKVNYECSANVQAERRSLFLVTIPGYNKWAENIENELIGFSEKTGHRANSSSMHSAQLSSTNGESTLKRTLSDDDAMDVQTSDDNMLPNKRLNVKLSSDADTNGSIPTAVLSREFLLNSPIPERPSRACLVKVRPITIKYFPIT